MATDTRLMALSIVEEQYPRYDPAHGTPDPMVRRLLTIQLPKGSARFEQTDYGHPGRFNPWDPRGIDMPLQPRTNELTALCDALSSLLS
ncbi:MAG TPA: hypothetical protein VJP07_00820 [Dehalococcoidia bacterium]|nr:hypothetical protein [Dehalococcoidia bacterium]